MVVLWEQGSQAPENSDNFYTIAEWWKSLSAKSITWKQRMISEDREVDWSPQKFDETFEPAEVDVKGITLYWKKTSAQDMSNITPAKLEFNPRKQRVWIYPENQKEVLISVEVPGAVSETMKMTNPAWFTETLMDDAGNVTGYKLIVLDEADQTEVQIDMDQTNLDLLKNAVCSL